jgi:hypothetical protein
MSARIPALSLRGEIDALTQQRNKDLKNATYLGKTPAQAREFASWQNTSGYSKVQLESTEMEFRCLALNHGYSSFLQMSIIGLLWRNFPKTGGSSVQNCLRTEQL